MGDRLEGRGDLEYKAEEVGVGATEGLRKAMAGSNLCNWKLNPEGFRNIMYATTIIIRI